MLGERLSAWFGPDHGDVVKDVLSGRERILKFGDPWRYPCRTLSACHFAGLNFVRVGFKHVDVQRARRSSSTSVAQWLNSIIDHRVLEEVLSPSQQLSNEQLIPLDDMCRVPLFENSLEHVATKYGPPSMILFKQSLRQLQLNASPISAMIVSRGTGTTVCLKLRENSKNIFLVVDFTLAPPQHGHSRSPTLALAISTSLEQAAARLSGILPVDNHMVTRDRQWQAQLFKSCTICVFAPVEGFVLWPDAESSTINQSIELLKTMGETDDPTRHVEDEVETRRGLERDWPRSGQPSGSSHGEVTQFNIVMAAQTASRGYAGRVSGGSLEEMTRMRTGRLSLRTTLTPYERTKRYCRIFFPDDESSASTSQSSSQSTISSFSEGSESSDEDACFECVICFENIPEEEGIHLPPCAHGFCRHCLAGHVFSKIEERKFPVFCPLCMTEEKNTNPSVVSKALVKRLGVSEAQYMLWTELEMAHLYVRVHCRRCNHSAFVEKEDYEKTNEVNCPFPGCMHTWCKDCQQSIPISGSKHSCDGTEELDYLVKQMGWKYCPRCKTPVQKNGGCNHMTCVTPACNTHFCYRCGKQITKSSIPLIVRSAVNAHFKQCLL